MSGKKIVGVCLFYFLLFEIKYPDSLVSCRHTRKRWESQVFFSERKLYIYICMWKNEKKVLYIFFDVSRIFFPPLRNQIEKRIKSEWGRAKKVFLEHWSTPSTLVRAQAFCIHHCIVVVVIIIITIIELAHTNTHHHHSKPSPPFSRFSPSCVHTHIHSFSLFFAVTQDLLVLHIG